MKARHGWLARNPSAPSVLAGVRFDGSFPTRREEYGFLHDHLASTPPGVCLDAGAGFNAEIHVAPYIAAELGWHVEAVDLDLRQFALQFHRRVRRTLASIAATPFPDGVFDLVYSISTIEHVDEATRNYFVIETYRLLKPGGYVLVTTDDTPPEVVAEWFGKGFDVGDLEPFEGEHLEPRVSYLIARKRA